MKALYCVLAVLIVFSTMLVSACSSQSSSTPTTTAPSTTAPATTSPVQTSTSTAPAKPDKYGGTWKMATEFCV